MDHLSNLLSSIQNGQKAHLLKIKVTKTKLNIKLLDLLLVGGFILGYKFNSLNKYKIDVYLKYINNQPIIKKINPVSKPGKVFYINIASLWKLKLVSSSLIISTPKGLLFDSEARRLNLGGEVICKIQY